MDLEVQEDKSINTTNFGNQEKKLRIITSHELLEMLPFGKTKFNQLLKAGELPLMKIGNDYITTESAVEKWIIDNMLLFTGRLDLKKPMV